MDLRVDSKVIPTQSLEGKICKVSKIIGIFPCSELGEKSVFSALQEARNVAVQIKNVSDTVGDEFCQIYDQVQFTEFRREYLIQKVYDLIGKPVLSVYDNDAIGALRGLIPLRF